MLFQVKEKSKYRSRSGFSQSDGIAQFSATYNRRSKYKLAPRMDSINGINDSLSDHYRPPSYEPYRPQQPRSLFPYCSDDESYLNRQNSSLHSPQWVILLLFRLPTKEIVERRDGEPIKFLFLPKMGVLGSQASTEKKLVVNSEQLLRAVFSCFHGQKFSF